MSALTVKYLWNVEANFHDTEIETLRRAFQVITDTPDIYSALKLALMHRMDFGGSISYGVRHIWSIQSTGEVLGVKS